MRVLKIFYVFIYILKDYLCSRQCVFSIQSPPFQFQSVIIARGLDAFQFHSGVNLAASADSI